MLRRVPQYTILLALLAFFAVFLIYPIALTVQGGFVGDDHHLTTYHIANIFRDANLRLGLLHSFWIAVCATTLATLIALPLAVLSAKFDFPGKAALSALILVPMILPPFVGAIGLHHLLGRSGAINSLLI